MSSSFISLVFHWCASLLGVVEVQPLPPVEMMKISFLQDSTGLELKKGNGESTFLENKQGISLLRFEPERIALGDKYVFHNKPEKSVAEPAKTSRKPQKAPPPSLLNYRRGPLVLPNFAATPSDKEGLSSAKARPSVGTTVTVEKYSPSLGQGFEHYISLKRAAVVEESEASEGAFYEAEAEGRQFLGKRSAELAPPPPPPPPPPPLIAKKPGVKEGVHKTTKPKVSQENLPARLNSEDILTGFERIKKLRESASSESPRTATQSRQLDLNPLQAVLKSALDNMRRGIDGSPQKGDDNSEKEDHIFQEMSASPSKKRKTGETTQSIPVFQVAAPEAKARKKRLVSPENEFTYVPRRGTINTYLAQVTVETKEKTSALPRSPKFVAPPEASGSPFVFMPPRGSIAVPHVARKLFDENGHHSEIMPQPDSVEVASREPAPDSPLVKITARRALFSPQQGGIKVNSAPAAEFHFEFVPPREALNKYFNQASEETKEGAALPRSPKVATPPEASRAPFAFLPPRGHITVPHVAQLFEAEKTSQTLEEKDVLSIARKLFDESDNSEIMSQPDRIEVASREPAPQPTILKSTMTQPAAKKGKFSQPAGSPVKRELFVVNSASAPQHLISPSHTRGVGFNPSNAEDEGKASASRFTLSRETVGRYSKQAAGAKRKTFYPTALQPVDLNSSVGKQQHTQGIGNGSDVKTPPPSPEKKLKEELLGDKENTRSRGRSQGSAKISPQSSPTKPQRPFFKESSDILGN